MFLQSESYLLCIAKRIKTILRIDTLTLQPCTEFPSIWFNLTVLLTLCKNVETLLNVHKGIKTWTSHQPNYIKMIVWLGPPLFYGRSFMARQALSAFFLTKCLTIWHLVVISITITLWLIVVCASTTMLQQPDTRLWLLS